MTDLAGSELDMVVLVVTSLETEMALLALLAFVAGVGVGGFVCIELGLVRRIVIYHVD